MEDLEMNEQGLTTPQVAEVIETSPRMPSFWADRGYLRPSLQEAEGRGSKRLWSRQDAVQALLVKLLLPHLSAGMLRRLARVVEGYRNALDPALVWRIPLGGEEGVIVRFYRDGVLCGEAQVQKLTGGRGELMESGKPSQDTRMEDAPVTIVVDLSQLNTLVDKGLEKIK